MSTCSICLTAPCEDDRHACRACAYGIRAALAEIPRQLPFLRASLERDGGPAQRGSGRATAPLPGRLDTLDLLGPGQPVPVADPHGDHTGGIPLTALLHGWATYIAAEVPAIVHRPGHPPMVTVCDGPWARRGTGITAWCSWLTAYLPYAAGRPWVGTFAEQLDDALARVRAITRLTPQRRPKMAPCPNCSGFALLEVDGEWYIRCEACPRVMTREEYAEHARQVLPPLTQLAVRMAAAEAARDAQAVSHDAA